MHKVVGIIAPSGDELAPIEKSMGAVVRTCRAGLEFLSGMLNGVKCVAVLIGLLFCSLYPLMRLVMS